MRLTPFNRSSAIRRLASGEEGFTMIFAILTLLISGLLVASAFTAASGDINLTRTSTLQAKAYYAALSGVQRYQHELSSNPNYWIECEKIGTEAVPKVVTGTTDESFYVKTLGSTGHSACEKGKQTTTLETSGAAKGTFRILSTGIAGSGSSAVKRLIVATFAHPGFTKYVYESNYEVEDPSNFEPEPTECEHYYAYRSTHTNSAGKKLTSVCPAIQFAPEDKVNGPLHTNDAAAICNSPTFGRSLADAIEMNGGHYAAGGCKNEPNIVGKYTEAGGSLLPPETDLELLETAGLKEQGRTELVLEPGSPNKIKISHKPGETPTTVPFPTNGVVYVENSGSGCAVAKYTPFGSDTENDAGCGNVYVHGEYTESLTIASADDVIVNGNLTTTSSPTSTPAGEPTGGATLGLIAENFVRVYHPVKKGYPTAFKVPLTEPQHNGECLTPEERSAKVLRSTEATEVTTTGLENGLEVEGTVAGQIEAGTLISELKAGNKLKLSKAAKPAAKEVSGKVLRSTEVSGIPATGLAVGQEVEGSGIEGGTTISEVKASENKIKLSKAAKPALKELSGKVLQSTEVSGITTTGLVEGQEVEGTVAGEIEAGTTISEVKAGAIKLSKAAKPPLAKELSGKVTKSTEVTGMTTTGLVAGQEVEGTLAATMEPGTTITEVKAAAIKLSKAPVGNELTATIANGSTTVSGISTTNLVVGQEVIGSVAGQLEATGTTITEIKAGENKIKLSKGAKKSETTKLKFYNETAKLKFYGETTKLKFYGETTKLKFYGETTTLKFYGETTKLTFWVPSGYEYNPKIGKCHKVEGAPYNEYREAENVYIVKCEAESSYDGNGFCDYENEPGNCSPKATNLKATEDPNKWGYIENPVIDAAILSTKHSWIVDNYVCGKAMGKLTVWGSIAQFWRGPVGTGGSPSSGYIKNYNYDERLATEQPPSFLSPSSTSWSLSRETAPPTGFKG